MAKTAPAYITAAQIKLVKILQRNLGIEDDDYRDLLMKRFGVSSCTQLTMHQATRLIEHFQGLSGNEKRRRRPAIPRARDGKVVRLASPKEHRKITALSSLIDWEFDDGLKRWMKKKFGIDRVRTAEEAYRVIEGCKKMIINIMTKAYGPEWWCKTYEDPGIMRFIEEHCPEEYR